MTVEQVTALEKPAVAKAATPAAKPAPLGAAAVKPMTTESVEANLRKLLGESPEEPQPEKPPGKGLPPGDDETPSEVPEGEEPNLTEGDGDARSASLPVEGGEPEVEEEVAAERTEWPESAQRRVDKLTAQKAELRDSVTGLTTERDELQARLAEMETQLQESAANAGPAMIPNEPLGFVKTPQELQKFVSGVKSNLRNVEDYLDGALEAGALPKFTKWAESQGAYNAESGEFDAGKLKQIKRLAQDALDEHVPARLQFLRNEAQLSQAAEARFPWLKDPKSTQHKAVQQVLQTIPEIRRLPNWKAIAAIFVKGLEVSTAEAAKAPIANGGRPNANPKVPARTPALPGRTTALPVRDAAAETSTEAMRKKAFASRDPKQVEAYLAAELQAGASR